MIASDVANAARDLYNATGDSFFTDTQIYNWLWQSCSILAREAEIIEAVSSQSTVIGTQSYAYPTQAFAIKRVTWRGIKLKRVTFRQDDALTLSNAQSAQTGNPIYYTDFNRTIYLRPIPDSVNTIQIYSFNSPVTLSAASSLEIPDLFQMDLVNPILRNMYAKDQNPQMASYYDSLWQKTVADAKRWKKKKLRTDSNAVVEDVDVLPMTIMGEA